MSTTAFLNRIKSGAILGWQQYRILPSITGAQGVLEGASGTSRLAQPPYNNQFGIKAGEGWNGKTVTLPTQEWNGSQMVSTTAEFRAYDSIEESIADHASFFTSTPWRTENYKYVIGEKDYKTAARALQSAGYATDPEYANKLIRIIEQYGLQQWDLEAFQGNAIPLPQNEVDSSSGMTTTDREADVSGRFSIKHLDYKDDTFYSPKGESVIYNPSLNDRFGFQTRSGDVLWIDHVLNVNSDNELEILEAGLEYMRENSQPNAQYTVSLKHIPENMTIGDTGLFIDHEFEPPLYIQARILEINESFSNPEKGSVVVGNVQEIQSMTDNRILELQNRLINTRKELEHEFYYGGDIKLTLTSSKGTSITNNGLIKPKELIKEQRTLTHLKANTPLVLELENPSVEDIDQFLFSGKIKDNILNVRVGEPVTVTEESNVPADISSGYIDKELEEPNPQGEAITIVDETLDTHELKVKEFKCEFIDLLGRVQHTENIAINHDATFSQGILRPSVTIKRIRLTSPQDITIEHISFKEPERVSDKAENTELNGVITQNDRPITNRYEQFLWTRISTDPNEDRIWNDRHKMNNTPFIDINPSDIYGLSNVFVLTALDEDGYPEVGGSIQITLIKNFDAYEIAVNNGFEGTRYEWTEHLKETDTHQGVPIKTASNELAYLHTAWANSITGQDFNLDYFAGAKYMGTYISGEQDDPTEPEKYTWIRVTGNSAFELWKEHTNQPNATMEDFFKAMKGEDGADGIVGKDGRTTYIHVAWATDPLGANFSLTPFEGATYMGVATTFDSEEPKTWTGYEWQYVKGEQGERGAQGERGRDGRNGVDGKDGQDGIDGKSAYTYHAWANKDSNGRFIDFSITDTERDWQGVYSSHSNQQSMNPNDYRWTQSPYSLNKELGNKANAIDLNNVIGTISSTTEKVRSIDTELTQTKNNVIITHSAEYVETIRKLVGDAEDASRQLEVLEQMQKDIETHFVFDDAFTIGKSNSTNKVRIDNEKMDFLDNETVITSLSGNVMEVQNVTVKNVLTFESHQIESDGKLLNFKYIGG